MLLVVSFISLSNTFILLGLIFYTHIMIDICCIYKLFYEYLFDIKVVSRVLLHFERNDLHNHPHFHFSAADQIQRSLSHV